ncbi:MAG: DUF3365 domain-containing protein [Bryobacterales bacterium]|nr:DUF3365 domain-containing protein [Bryobacterales bacterium]
MKLAVKFNLIFAAIFGLGLLATGLIADRFLESRARTQVLDQARLMMETSASVRTYTAEQIRPVLENFQRRDQTFFQQSVPAFAATQMFKYMRANYPEYSYKEAALNPTNPQDRAIEWEADVISMFRNDSAMKEFIGERDTPTGRTLYLAKPFVVTPPCMTCHSKPSVAPAAMVRTYGSNNGFGWKLGEVSSAQIVSVPMAIPVSMARSALLNLMIWLAAASGLSLLLLNVVLSKAVIRPVSQLSQAADEISKGNLDVPEFPVAGKDEVSVLADSFNRMHRSLVKAIKMLEG